MRDGSEKAEERSRGSRFTFLELWIVKNRAGFFDTAPVGLSSLCGDNRNSDAGLKDQIGGD
jgi:hypothetical protein